MSCEKLVGGRWRRMKISNMQEMISNKETTKENRKEGGAKKVWQEEDGNDDLLAELEQEKKTKILMSGMMLYNEKVGVPSLEWPQLNQ